MVCLAADEAVEHRIHHLALEEIAQSMGLATVAPFQRRRTAANRAGTSCEMPEQRPPVARKPRRRRAPSTRYRNSLVRWRRQENVEWVALQERVPFACQDQDGWRRSGHASKRVVRAKISQRPSVPPYQV